MELLHPIGEGAYGEVWLARNQATGIRRAVKIVYRAAFTDERPFNREFEGIKKFEAISHTHPSQLALFQVGRNDAVGYFYYVMELADPIQSLAGTDGRRFSSNSNQKSESRPVDSYKPRTLRSDLEGGRLPAARVLEIALSLTEALAHLHANGLVHRDIKPSNIIFVNGRPKLADIGLVTDASDNRSIVGTEGYLPNEGPGTPAADIFALGKVLYEALTGQDRRQFPKLPTELREWTDVNLVFELNEILLKACAADARQRYPSADSMLADLELLHAGKSLKRRQSIRRTAMILWKSAAALAFAAAIIWALQPRKHSGPNAFENSGTTNFAAFQAYDVAIKMVDTYTVQNLSNAVKQLERVVELDPNYAQAWSVLSICLSLSVDYGYLDGSQILPRALSCAEKAIALRPSRIGHYDNLAEIRLALGYDFSAVEPIFRKVLAASSPQSSSHHNFARILIYYGRFDEAEKILREIIDKDPARGGSYILLGQVYGDSGRFEEALAAYEKAIPTSNRPYLYFNRADLLASRHHRSAAASDLLRFVELHGFASLDPLNDGAALRMVFNERGPEEFLRRHIQLLEERRAAGRFVSSYDLARLYMHSGNREKAIEYLQFAVGEHRQMTLAVNVNPLFKPLHGDPRFHAILRQLRLE